MLGEKLKRIANNLQRISKESPKRSKCACVKSINTTEYYPIHLLILHKTITGRLFTKIDVSAIVIGVWSLSDFYLAQMLKLFTFIGNLGPTVMKYRL